MIVERIFYGSDFIKQFKRQPSTIQDIAAKKEKLFRSNPLHPSLRLHSLKGKLKGLFSISLIMNYRIVFSRKGNGDIIFISIGKHDIYGQ